jgi:hypothetical protein
VHGGNFLARSSAVKQHGAILGMQMHCNRTRVQRSVILASRQRVPRKNAPQLPPRSRVNPLLTINRAKFAQ